MVGDQVTDLGGRLAAGLGRVVHVLIGHGPASRALALALAAELGTASVWRPSLLPQSFHL